MAILVLGHNQTSAPVDLREKFTFTPDRLKSALGQITAPDRVWEAVILSTCNRNEIYGVAGRVDAAADALKRFLCEFHGMESRTLDETLYTFAEERAVEHLFEVAAGVDSMIVGETQVFSQVKDAYHQALESGATGVILNRLFHAAFETGKRVRNLTSISHGAVSVSFAAVELAKKIFENLENKTVFLIGAGETGELTARNLVNVGISSFLIANRTYDRARHLAESLGGKAIPFDEIYRGAEHADIVICSTAFENRIFSVDQVRDLMQKRKNSPLFIIDLAVPRDIDPDVSKLYNVFLYDMDDLDGVAEENRKRRAREVDKAKPIISESVATFMRWYRSLEVTPTIVSLREHFEVVRQRELAKHRRQVPIELHDKLDAVSRAMMNKILHDPMLELRKAVESGNGYVLAHALRKAFRLLDEDD